MNISKKALSNPVLIIIVFTLLGIMGLFTLKKVEINLWPDLKEPYLMVYTRYENADPQSVENAVTKIIEDGLVSVSNLKKITSISSEGTSIIELEFNYGVNLDAATNEVRDSIDSIRDYLPKNVKTPGIMKFTMNSMPIMTLAVRGNRNAEDLRYIADKEIKGILTQAAGVGQAIVSGGRKQIVRVELSQNRLAAFGLTVPQIASKLALENLDLGGGKIRDGYKNFVVRTSGEYSSVKEINDTVLKTINGYNVKLSDVGRAFFGYKDATESVYINEKPGVYISITKQSGTNAVKVADALYEKLEELKENLPGDIQIEVISDDSITIRETLNTLFSTAWQGILLAVLVLFIFLKSFKSTFIISISIPLSIIITFLLMHIFKITLNMMTLTGLILGVGMVVDASIVMIDNIYSYRVRGTRAKTAAILGSQEMISSVISGNLTTIVVFIPFLLYMKELDWMGQMAKDMIFTIVIAIVSSLFVAIFLVPVLAGHYLPLTNTTEKAVRNAVLKKLYDSFEKVIDKITEVYKKILYAALSHRKTTIFSAVAALFLSLALIPFLGMLPMSFVTTGSAAMVQPIGLGVLGGLLSSTFITLVLIPVLYSILMKDPVAEKSKIKMIELPSESEKTALEKQNEYNGKKADFRCEIIANQSVQEEITSLLEEKIEGFQYSVVEETFGRGLQSRKLGSSVWPEMNFVLTAYITKEELSVVTNVVESVKSIFHSEGIQMFAVTV